MISSCKICWMIQKGKIACNQRRHLNLPDSNHDNIIKQNPTGDDKDKRLGLRFSRTVRCPEKKPLPYQHRMTTNEHTKRIQIGSFHENT